MIKKLHITANDDRAEAILRMAAKIDEIIEFLAQQAAEIQIRPHQDS